MPIFNNQERNSLENKISSLMDANANVIEKHLLKIRHADVPDDLITLETDSAIHASNFSRVLDILDENVTDTDEFLDKISNSKASAQGILDHFDKLINNFEYSLYVSLDFDQTKEDLSEDILDILGNGHK